MAGQERTKEKAKNCERKEREKLKFECQRTEIRNHVERPREDEF